MARVLLFHWKEEEAMELVARLESWGHAVGWRGMRENKEVKITSAYQFRADVLVFDLNRMPVYSKYHAQMARKGRTTAHIPFVFVGGEGEKLEGLQRMFPEETFTDWKKLKGVLGKVRRGSLAPRALPDLGAEPVRELWQKLGLKAGLRVALGDAPREFWTALGNVPEGIDYEAPLGKADLAFFFVEDPDSLGQKIDAIERAGARIPVWVIFRKGSGVKMPELRAVMIDCGLIDSKICSVNKNWAGMLVKRKKSV